MPGPPPPPPPPPPPQQPPPPPPPPPPTYTHTTKTKNQNSENTKKNHDMWRRWGTPQNFCLAFTDELEKQLSIKKLLKWANKKCKNFHNYNFVFFKKKIRKNTWRYHYFTPVCQKIWYDLQLLRYRVWQTEIGHYGPFFALLLP